MEYFIKKHIIIVITMINAMINTGNNNSIFMVNPPNSYNNNFISSTNSSHCFKASRNALYADFFLTNQSG